MSRYDFLYIYEEISQSIKIFSLGESPGRDSRCLWLLPFENPAWYCKWTLIFWENFQKEVSTTPLCGCAVVFHPVSSSPVTLPPYAPSPIHVLISKHNLTRANEFDWCLSPNTLPFSSVRLCHLFITAISCVEFYHESDHKVTPGNFPFPPLHLHRYKLPFWSQISNEDTKKAQVWGTVIPLIPFSLPLSENLKQMQYSS